MYLGDACLTKCWHFCPIINLLRESQTNSDTKQTVIWLTQYGEDEYDQEGDEQSVLEECLGRRGCTERAGVAGAGEGGGVGGEVLLCQVGGVAAGVLTLGPVLPTVALLAGLVHLLVPADWLRGIRSRRVWLVLGTVGVWVWRTGDGDSRHVLLRHLVASPTSLLRHSEAVSLRLSLEDLLQPPVHRWEAARGEVVGLQSPHDPHCLRTVAPPVGGAVAAVVLGAEVVADLMGEGSLRLAPPSLHWILRIRAVHSPWIFQVKLSK